MLRWINVESSDRYVNFARADSKEFGGVVGPWTCDSYTKRRAVLVVCIEFDINHQIRGDLLQR